MNNLHLPQTNSNVHRSLITVFSTFLTWFIGLTLAVYQVPGVPKVLMEYVTNNSPALLLALGIPIAIIPGIMNFILNFLFRRTTVQTY